VSRGLNRWTPGSTGHLPEDWLLGLVDRLAGNGFGSRNVPVLVHDIRIGGALRINRVVRIERALVMDRSTVGVRWQMSDSAAAGRTAGFALQFIANMVGSAAPLVA
jgi:hypothetical protein